MSQIIGTSPAKRMVFVDNGSVTQVAWYNLSMAPGLIRPLSGVYGTPFPPIPHANGTCMSFADGHVEYWKWENADTITQGKYWKRVLTGEIPEAFKSKLWIRNPDNEDGNRVRKAIWTIAWLK